MTTEKPAPDGAPEFKTIEEAKAELERARDALKAANSEAADRRKKLKAFEDADAERVKADQVRRDAELSDIQKLTKAAEDERAKTAAAEQRAQRLELRRDAARGVKALKLEFASDAAEDDAIDKLLPAVKFEDGKLLGLDEALKGLQRDRGYLFAKPAPSGARAPTIDATARGHANTDELVDDKGEQELKQRFGIR